MTLRERAVPVAMLLLVALLLRAVPALVHRYELPWVTTADSSVYLALADRLRTAGAFERAPLIPSALESPVTPETFRTPGYPALIAVVQGLGGSPVAWLIAVQSALDVLAVLGCYLLGGRLFSPRVGFIAATLVTVDLPHIVYSNMIMSDVPFAACALAAFVLAERAVATERATLGVVSGLLAGLATMVRPVGALLFILLAGYALFHPRGRYRLAAGIVTGALVLPGAWVARNAVVADWPILSSAHYFNLYHYAASRVAARAKGMSVAAALQQSQRRAGAILDGLAPPAWSQEYARLGIAVFQQYPASTAREALMSLVETLAMGERRNLLKITAHRRGLHEGGGFREGPRHAGAVATFLQSAGTVDTLLVSGQVAWNGLVLLGAFLGIWSLWRDERRAEVSLLGLVCAYLAGASLMEGSGRMRLAFSPYLFLLAAYGMSRCLDRWNETRRNRRRAVTRAGSIACLMLGAATLALGAGQSSVLAQPVTVLDRLLATVADQPITLSDVRAARLLGLVPETEDTAAVVERLIDRELMRIEVERFVTAEPPAKVIDARLAAVRERLSGPDGFDAAVRSTGLTVDQLRAVLRDEIRIAAYLEQRFGATAASERSDAIDEWVASLRRRVEIRKQETEFRKGIQESGRAELQGSRLEVQGQRPSGPQPSAASPDAYLRAPKLDSNASSFGFSRVLDLTAGSCGR